MGNETTPKKLNDSEAIIRWRSNYLLLNDVSEHIKTQISYDECEQLFEKIWKERANAAGWRLQIEYLDDHECTFHFIQT